MPASPQFDAALQIVTTLRTAGHQAFLAGGCVRDLLLGCAPKDFDVATSATPDVVLRSFPRTFAVGAHFGIVLVSTTTCGGADCGCVATTSGGGDFKCGVAANPEPPESAPQATQCIEVATFRSDGAYSDGRHPDAVRYSTSAEHDVERRDFTINGLLLDAERAATCLDSPAELRLAVTDFVGGLADLDAGLLRAIGEPQRRFAEDHLRMMRAVRFAARLGFELEPQTFAAIKRQAAKIAAISNERVRDELARMLTDGQARRAFERLDETGLLAQILPEIARMKGVEQPPRYHPEGDVWLHTLGLLEQLQAGCPLTLAWGALLHDVGKPATFRRADRIRFDGHVEVGVAVAAEICRRFRFSNDETRLTLALIENHMRFASVAQMNSSTLKRFFRLQDFDQHLALHRMDCLAGSGNLEHWELARERYLAMPAEVVRPLPLLNGRHLIDAGYQPGARFKQMLHAVEDAQLEGIVGTAEEAMRLVQERFPLLDCVSIDCHSPN